MSTNKYIDRICIAAVAAAFLISVLFMYAEPLGIRAYSKAMGYENRLFDVSKVHTIDIVMEGWEEFIEACENEEYSACTVTIDGESYKNTAIRGKGNTSLSSVSSMNSDRYSFKVEFDHYDSNKTYHGLDKLSLNNLIQDNTFMKDYLTYRMMAEFGADAPLCSFAYLTVNGEDWGLYLAVEGVEDSFLQRSYGNAGGELYKPDSMSFGGGRGNGKEFDISEFTDENGEFTFELPENFNPSEVFGGEMPDMEGFTPPEAAEGEMPDMGGFIPPETPQRSDTAEGSERKNNRSQGGRGGFGGGMGSDDVKLKYIDDNTESYSNIFNNAKTDITDEDKNRLISALKALNEGTDIEATVNIDKVIRYFVVHNFVCNGDSYTGSMIHNYYLYEEKGQLSMIPWDYNLAFGTFQGGNAEEQVNYPIDSPVSGDISDRPMISWIFESEEYTKLYHEYFAEFLSTVDITGIIESTEEIISPYVEKDPSKFCTYEEFQQGVSTLKQFCTLRTESVQGQLEGTIPSTSDGQSADSSALIDASEINISHMGTMGGGMGFGGGRNNRPSGERTDFQSTPSDSTEPPQMVQGEIPEGFDPSQMTQREIPESFDTSQMAQGEIPENFDPSQMTQDKSNEPQRESTDNKTSSGSFPQQNEAASQNEGVVLTAVCLAVLAMGIIIAAKFKR